MRSLLAGLSRRRTVAPPVTNLVRSRSVASFFRTPTVSMQGADRYATDPTLYAIASALAEDTGAVEFQLYTPSETGKDEDRVEIMRGQHPAVDLFANPNPFHSRSEFVELAQLWVELAAECVILVEWLGAMPVRMWPMDPSKFTPNTAGIIGVPAGKKFLTGWTYTADDGTQIPLSVKEILQIKLPNPKDPYRGAGAVQPSLTDMDSGKYSAEWNRMFFLNGASPDGVVQIEDGFSDDEHREFVDRWRESHQGIGNAHRVAVLENGAVWVPNQMTQRDMQFHELRAQSSDFTRKAFRFPKTMLGDTDTANRAVAEAGEYQYGKWLISSRARRWTSLLNNRLMPLYGKDQRELVWDFKPIVDADEKTEADTFSARATGVNTLIQAGFAAEDVLATAGLPPMKWEKPQQPGFDEDGKPFAKPGEQSDTKPPGDSGKSASGSGGNGSKRA